MKSPRPAEEMHEESLTNDDDKMRSPLQTATLDKAANQTQSGGWSLPSGEDLITFAAGIGLAAGQLLPVTAEVEADADEVQFSEEEPVEAGPGAGQKSSSISGLIGWSQGG
jgi:hypothetical protein